MVVSSLIQTFAPGLNDHAHEVRSTRHLDLALLNASFRTELGYLAVAPRYRTLEVGM